MPYATDRPSLEKVSTVENTRGSGPGGQHRNKVETGVRVTHTPTGLVVLVTRSRSREQNLGDAFTRLGEKLEALQRVVTPRKATRPSRGAKRRRLDDKKRAGQKKTDRRGGHDD